MEVGVSFLGHVVVDDEVDSFDVDASAEKIGGNQQSGTVALEKVVVFDSLFLFESGVDADGVEELGLEELSELLSTVDSVDEDDDLVEGEVIQQMGQFFELLGFLDIDKELGQTVEHELTLIDEDIDFIL